MTKKEAILKLRTYYKSGDYWLVRKVNRWYICHQKPNFQTDECLHYQTRNAGTVVGKLADIELVNA